MRSFIAALTACSIVLSSVPVRAQGGGTHTYHFSAPGDSLQGNATENPDGTATIQGTWGTLGFMGTGQISAGKNGKPHFSGDVYVDAKNLKRQGGNVRHIEIDLDGEDYADGNPTDDEVGSVTVETPLWGLVGQIPIYG